MRLGNPIELPTGPMFWVAAGGLATEIVSLALLFRQQSHDLNTRGAYWHILQTFVGSLIIIVAAVVIRLTGFQPIDPILGMAFGLVLLWAGWGILRESLHLLMDGTPGEVSLHVVAAALEALPGVENVHHIHGWALTSGKHVFSAHLKLAEGADHAAVLSGAHTLLRERFGFYFSTLQLENRCLDEAAARDIDILRAGGQDRKRARHDPERNTDHHGQET